MDFVLAAVLLIGTPVLSLKPPAHLWPLGNTSLYNDVIGTSKVRHEKGKQCFIFTDGPTALPYTVMRMDDQPEASFESILDGKTPLQDLTISYYVYPENDASDISGTILNYQVEDREILKVRALANTFLASFRDEYGMSAGTMYIVNFYTPNTWNHVVITRDYETGRIAVFKDGIEMYNEDDEFSDVISFPNGGFLRMGKSHDEDDEDGFDGNFACVQLYQTVVPATNISDVLGYCLPENWKKHSNYYYENKDGKTCLTDPPIIVLPDAFVNPVVSMTTLTREPQWLAFLNKHGLKDGERTSGYWSRKLVNKIPEVSDDVIGSFNATDKNVCARLCMRVDTCQAFFVGRNMFTSTLKECILYDNQQKNFVENMGADYFEIKE